jgi:hypothetical protein
MKHIWRRSKEVFSDRVVIDDGQFYPNTLCFIKIRVHYYKDDLHAFKWLVDHLAMNLPHLQGNYCWEGPPNDATISSGQFLLIWEFLIMQNEYRGHYSILALYRYSPRNFVRVLRWHLVSIDIVHRNERGSYTAPCEWEACYGGLLCLLVGLIAFPLVRTLLPPILARSTKCWAKLNLALSYTPFSVSPSTTNPPL